MGRNTARLIALIQKFAAQPGESEWVEFKENNHDPEMIGEYLSALSNSAALHGKPHGYLIWGVKDDGHALVGTSFQPRIEKVKGQELENWLVTQLTPRIHIQIHEAIQGGKQFVVFEIPAAAHTPVRFKDSEFIRVGSSKKKLREHPEMERSLWTILSKTSFEQGVAIPDATSDRVLELLDYPEYFRLMKQRLPDDRSAIFERLAKDGLIINEHGDDYFQITNVGALLFARKLSEFPSLSRKALRVIIYQGGNRVETSKEYPVDKGYAVGFEGAIGYINDQLPQNEHIGQALRATVRRYPELAVRELVANALIHQDFSVTGAGPMVEIFDDRMEITNPGRPLIDTLRFIDEPPKSRNEGLASVMRRVGICEERGSGIDKVFDQIEFYQLPSPNFRATDHGMITSLFGPKEFSQMDREERVRACYWHACFRYVSNEKMTNASLRQRLGVEDKNYPTVSRIISDSVAKKLIKAYTGGSESKRDSSYLPFWA